MRTMNRTAKWTAVWLIGLALSSCTPATVTDSTPPSSPAPTPSSSPAARIRPFVDLGGTGIMGAGTYVLDQFPVEILFDIPDGNAPGWHPGKSSPDAAILLWYTPPEISYGLAFWNVDNVYVDPCNAGAGELEPPIGSSVDDLVAALSTLPGFQATAPLDVTVGAFQGKRVDLTALDSGSDCPQPIAFSAGADLTDLSPGETRPFSILNVDGVRIVVTIIEPAEADPAVRAELYQIVDSIRLAQP